MPSSIKGLNPKSLFIQTVAETSMMGGPSQNIHQHTICSNSITLFTLLIYYFYIYNYILEFIYLFFFLSPQIIMDSKYLRATICISILWPAVLTLRFINYLKVAYDE